MASVKDPKKEKEMKKRIKYCHPHNYTSEELKRAQNLVNLRKAYLVFGN